MIETILKLYAMYMAVDVRTPVPHLFGPPGCGKSTSVEEAAKIIGCGLHTINVSRISPLELEGVQMPQGIGEEMKLKLLHATFWTQLKPGDILLFDEFLRGFPEVYNGLLDIFTSRMVGGFELPKVFIIAASNSTVAYDKALEDRLLHLPVEDPRHKKSVKKRLAQMMVDQLGLLPEMVGSQEMTELLDMEVLPMYEVLDSLGKGTASPVSLKGHSLRNLIGQAQLRQVESIQLREVLKWNNSRAIAQSKYQYVFLADGKDKTLDLDKYQVQAKAIKNNPALAARLSHIQAMNLELNLQLIETEAIRQEKGLNVDDDALDEIFS